MQDQFQSVSRGRKTFLAGAISLIVFGAVHLLAVYHGNFVPPADEKQAEIKRLAMEYILPMGPFKPTAWGGNQILNSSYSVLLIYVGVLNLLALRPAAQAGRLRAFATCNVLFVALLLAITILFQFPPPMIFATTSLSLFGVSWLKQGT
jgi:hypothetical protein